MPLFDHFDLLAPFYDRLIAPPENSPLAELARLPTQGPLLDVGGGTGRVAQQLKGLADQLVVLDASRKMVGQAQEKDELTAVVGTSEQIPFCDGCFDRVVVVDAYHHLEDQQRSLKELWRVIRPGGLLVIEEPDINTWPVRLAALAEKLMLMRSRFVPPEGIARELQQMGGEVKILKERPNAWVVAEKKAE